MNHLTKVVAAVVIWLDDGVLLLQRKINYKELDTGKGLWDLPGGKINFGEPMQEALQRELTEETGTITLNSSLMLQEVLSYKIQDDHRVTHRVDLIYSMELATAPAITLGEEHGDWRFTNKEGDIVAADMISQIRQFLLLQLKTRSAKH